MKLGQKSGWFVFLQVPDPPGKRKDTKLLLNKAFMPLTAGHPQKILELWRQARWYDIEYDKDFHVSFDKTFRKRNRNFPCDGLNSDFHVLKKLECLSAYMPKSSKTLKVTDAIKAKFKFLSLETCRKTLTPQRKIFKYLIDVHVVWAEIVQIWGMGPAI